MEFCTSVASIYDLYEYIYKGFNPGDALKRGNAKKEIVEFVEGSYICTFEGVWRIWALTCMARFYLSCDCLSTQKITNMSLEVSSRSSLQWFVTVLRTTNPQRGSAPVMKIGKHLWYSDYAELLTYHGKSKYRKVCQRELEFLAVCTSPFPM